MHAAIIGAGLAGLTCARALQARDHRVTLFDRGRAPGGRMSSRRLGPDRHADHGTRAFLVHDERFAGQVDEWLKSGVAAVWTPELVMIDGPGVARPNRFKSTRYVGTPEMRAPIIDLANQLGTSVTLHRGRNIAGVHHSGSHWVVQDDEGEAAAFDAVALAVPAPNAAALLTEVPHLHAVASAVPMTPAWAATVVFPNRLPIAFDAANVSIGARHEHAGVLAWMDRESSKPGRTSDECWVLHAGEEWTRDHINDDAEAVGAQMLDAFFSATGVTRSEPTEIHTHRWRYAFPVAPLCDGCLWDDQLLIGACGDWCMGSRVEGAYLSGLAMASRVMGERSDFLEPCLPTHGRA
ncbi:MAG: FAD-dependent oxidoreductase [Phycisphaeraceae bacterium]|nr:MAG: FAD-dependent oxidoreductase [Phycisphaeraceae bacterium]